MSEPIANVSEGKLRGKVELGFRGNRFYSFKGVPYAEPPIGELRFKASIPVKSWSGILDATRDGNPSIQISTTDKVIGSEDCLFLNVFTPSLPVDTRAIKQLYLKPVMVFVHGGYFMIGSNKSHTIGPHFLMTKDVVLVTINYRLGLLGSLNCEDDSLDIPGNAAFKDIVLALKWIEKNITNFMGDPHNVTVIGQSSGGSTVHLLLLSPTTRGLIHKVIIQSGSALIAASYVRSLKQLANDMGFANKTEREIIQYLKNCPAEEIIKIQGKLELRYPLGNRRGVAGATIEKPHEAAFLTKSPVEILRSESYPKIPILMGYNSNEGTILDIVLQRCKLPLDVYWSNSQLLVPHFWNLKEGCLTSLEAGRRIVQYYFPTEHLVKNPKQGVKQIYKDVVVRAILQAAIAHSRTGPVFLYKMTIETDLNLTKTGLGILNRELAEEEGAFHGDELGYLFHMSATPEIASCSREDISQQRFLRMWTNFARFGNPTPAYDPLVEVEWEQTQPESLQYMEIGAYLKMCQKPDQQIMKFWDQIEKFSLLSSKL